MNLNMTAFYFVKAQTLFFFYGENFGLPNKCNVFANVEPTNIYETLNNFIGVDWKWLVTVTSPRDGGPYVKDRPDMKTQGSQLAFMVDANTFPKPTTTS